MPVLINRSGGTAAALGDTLEERVNAAFAGTGMHIELELLDGDELKPALKRHSGAPVIAIGGGDGTIGTAAAQLSESTTAMAILPLGTRNHLAKQLGVPLDLDSAAKLAVDGQRRRIDLGRAGTRVFVNNASFGLYTRFVRKRDGGPWPRWRGSLHAAWHVLRNMRAQFFALRIDGSVREIVTPLLFIGNNEYSMDLGSLGERDSLVEHTLSLCAVSDKGAAQMISLAVRGLLGMAEPSRDFVEHARAREIVIEGNGSIEGTFDGELAVLPLPLRIRSLPNALGVITPRECAPPERALTRIH